MEHYKHSSRLLLCKFSCQKLTVRLTLCVLDNKYRLALTVTFEAVEFACC